MGERQKMVLKEKWARVYIDESEDSKGVVELLRNAGFRVITFTVKGSLGPELRVERETYRGLREIQGLINKVNT